MRLPLPLPFVSLLLASLLPLASALLPTFNSGSGMTFCKCLCFSNSTIIPLYLPKDPIHPCLSCTKQFCLDQKLPACFGASSGDEDLDTGTGEEGDVEARCFQRDSPKSHFLVILFIIVTSVLLVGAVLKTYGIDLQAIFQRGGFRGLVQEFASLASTITSRRGSRTRGGGQYSSMPL